MKDFKKRDLYAEEIGKFNKFLETKLVTASEYDRNATDDDEDDELDSLDPTSFFGMSSGDDSGFGFDSMSTGNDYDFSNMGFGSSLGSSQGYDSWKNERPIDQFLKAPLYLTQYTFNSLLEGGEKSNASNDNFSLGMQEGLEEVKKGDLNFDISTMKTFFKHTMYASGFLFLSSLLGKSVGMNTLHNTTLGLITGSLGVLSSDFFNWYYFNKGLLSKMYENKNPKGLLENNDMLSSFTTDTSENPFDVDSENPLGNESAFSFEGDNDFSFESESENSLDVFGSSDNDNNYFNDDIEDDEDEDEDYEKSPDILGNSSIDVSDNYLFRDGLKNAFVRNERYKGQYLKSRKEVLDSFSEMVLNNDKAFSKWKTERERGVIYNNIAYTIYKALFDINKSFATDEKAKMTIMSITTSPLLYKIELKLPQKYFVGEKLQRNLKHFENHLKESARDSDVQCTVSLQGDTFILRFLRLDYGGLISLGDILRYKDDSGKTAYEKMIDPKNHTPMLVGLKDNEYPHVVDLEKNTAMVIVGGSGSGKSWLTYELGMNWVVTNDYNDLNVIVLDYKNAPFWQAFARMPHVIGYHSKSNISDDEYLDLCIKVASEVLAECNRRQDYLESVDMEDIIEVRKTYRENGEYDKLKEMPLLIFAIDEITTTMSLLSDDKERYDTFRSLLSSISQVGRSAGVRLLSIGQRAIDKSIPKNVRANSTLLFGMKMNATSDFGMLFEQSKEVEVMTKPTKAGQGIIQSEDILGFHSLKTLTPGGNSNGQIRTVLRVIAMDWLRRASGRDDLYKLPYNADFKTSYNRPKFLDLSYAEMKQGMLLGKSEKDIMPEIAVDLLTGKKEINPTVNVMPSENVSETIVPDEFDSDLLSDLKDFTEELVKKDEIEDIGALLSEFTIAPEPINEVNWNNYKNDSFEDEEDFEEEEEDDDLDSFQWSTYKDDSLEPSILTEPTKPFNDLGNEKDFEIENDEVPDYSLDNSEDVSEMLGIKRTVKQDDVPYQDKNSSKSEKTLEPLDVVQKPKIKTDISSNDLSIQEFIVEYGNRGQEPYVLDFMISKDVLQQHYTKNEIKKALRSNYILEAKDAYVLSI